MARRNLKQCLSGPFTHPYSWPNPESISQTLQPA